MHMLTNTQMRARTKDQRGQRPRLGRFVIRVIEVLGPTYLWWAGVPFADAGSSVTEAPVAQEELTQQALHQLAYRHPV